MRTTKQNLDPRLYPDYKYPEMDIPKDKKFRENVANLGKKITDRVPQKLGLKKIQQNDPEYWGLSAVLSDEEIEIASKMNVRDPKTLDELVEITGKNAKELQPLLDNMSITGILEYNWENDKREKQYVLPMFVPGSSEFMNMNSDVLREHPQMGLFFERMTRLPLEKITPYVKPGGSGIGMHVIPVEKAIEMENESVDLEHISHWLDKYDGKYAKSPCSCRKSRLTHGEGCADDPEGWCIAVGDMADYICETNKGGQYIDKKEALEIFKKAEDNGFVHQITNIDGKNKIFAICNCNVNVCYALRTSQLFNTPNMSASAYRANVDVEKCVACGKCVEVCPSGAVKLGQKLCDKEGCEVEYPKIPLPHERKWGPWMWEHNYRDTNRINCYDTGTSPCKTACPAHIAIQGYLQLTKEGKYREALELIKKDNPLPAICGSICNKYCEAECTRGDVDEAVAIDDVKRFVAELDLNSETRYIPKPIVPTLKGKFDEKIAIIGAGPAGLSCAYYLALMGYKPTVFEREEKPGGMLMYGIPNFKLDKKLIEAEVDIIKQMGVEFKFGVDVGEDIKIADLRKDGYKGFLLAIGCQRGNILDIKGSDNDHVISAVDFLKSIQLNENINIGQNVVVIGGGNVAIDAARSAKRLTEGDITVVSLESHNEMPAKDDEVEEAINEGIIIENSWGPKEITVKDGKIKEVIFKKCISVFNDEGKFDPKYDDSQIKKIKCDYVVFSVGQSVLWKDLINDADVSFYPDLTVGVDKLTLQTVVEDIFCAGDAQTGPKFAIDAIAAGREAAISLHRYVHDNCSLTIGRNRRDFIALDKDNVDHGEYSQMPRQVCEKSSEKMDFSNNIKAFSEEQAKIESARCLRCGASFVDVNKCIGCGLCTTKCVFDAITISRTNPECTHMIKSEDKLKEILPNMAKLKIKTAFKSKEA